MDPNQPFTPAQVAALRSFLQMMEAAGPAGGGNASQLPPTQPASSSLANNAPAPTPTPAPPITSLYQSHRLASQGHPAPQPSQPANGGFQFQPFVGANTLGLPLATTNVNQARMASASATIPRGPALQARQSRRRGPATAPPGLPHLGLTAEVRRVFVGDGSDLVRVTVKVHPGTSETHRFILFRFRNGSFNQYLTEHHLLYNMDLASSTTISSLMLDIASRMQSSPFLYKFDPSLVNSSVAGEDFRLRLLRLVGRGQPSGRTAAEITLTPEPVVGSMSIADMLQQKGKYVGANRVCLEGNPLRFVIHFAASSPWYTKGGRRHGPSCLVDHFQHLFPSDQQLVSIADDADTSGGEEIDDDDDDDAAEAEQSLMPSAPASTPSASHGQADGPSVPSNATQANSPSPVPTQPNSPSPPAPAQLAQGEPSFNSVASFLPATIWETPFVATRPAAEMVVRAQQLPDYAYSRACEGSGFQSLTVRAPTIQECVDLYDRKLTEAAIANDYTEIMAVQRRFQIDGQPGTPSSVGEGIEREVTWLLFQKYANEQQAAWFAPRLGEGCSPQIAYPFVSESRIPDSRIIGMKKLGAACALLMIQGLTPHPMDPTVFQFIIHGCNLHSLTPGFVGEWHPEFKNELAQFLSLGPQDDISRFEYLFISYLNSSIAPYRHRDESSHKAIGSLILYNALFGSIPPNHPEWKAFREGVTLRCPRGRFTFPQLVRSFEGGSDQFLSLTWSTSVRYDSLAQMITFDTGSYPEMLGTLQLADPSYTFNGLFLEFLQGTGVPCPGLFDEVKASFSPLVDLSGISSADFRSRMFVWAATGHPFLDNEDRDVHVIVRRAPPMMLNDRQRTVFQAGNLLFQTCSKRVTIYGPHIIKLLTDTYPPSGATEPASFKEAFSFWLLVQVLNAIGRHSIL